MPNVGRVFIVYLRDASLQKSSAIQTPQMLPKIAAMKMAINQGALTAAPNADPAAAAPAWNALAAESPVAVTI